ncbi:2-hydroxychromene-2-carboxylate isomerase [Reyranella aquatilis]|uniref:2-hydroxychromene-2-carboxylate isomerase n=1 Tax=Reyranella aquatilis TaxID=2035356 RepID=A0ABS8KWG7_9HYPH|nr:2-hydroxychromene-2-carboxylate isomerase [Reyranella aquatilis]MCC8429993.1 2-hydroxychromene-2-carboxylate isomerase [Reyranella aquatilis]
MAQRVIDYWFTTGSTHNYLTAMRLPDVAAATGVAFRWRPFDLRTLFDERGYFPFPKGSPKTAYMFRDIERRAAARGIPIALPVPYPLPDSMTANLVALLGIREGWGIDYIRAAYRRWFQEGQPAGTDPNLSASLAEIGQDRERVLSLATAAANRDALTAETDVARSIGLVGSPSFVVDGEVFWGDDRLEDAVTWARHGTLACATPTRD